MGSTPRPGSTPSTASPPSTSLAKRMEDFRDTPPPAPLSSVRLKSHGSRMDTPRPAEEVTDRDIMEEEGEEELVRAEHIITQRVDKPTKRRRLFAANNSNKVNNNKKELALKRRQGLRSAGRICGGTGEEDSQEGRG